MRLPRPELLVPVAEAPLVVSARARQRRRARAAVTLVAGTSLLAVTLRIHRGSTWFAVFGLVTAAVWVAGAVLSGPIPWRSVEHRRARGVVPAALIGVAAFAGFAAAAEAAKHLPVLSGALHSVLGKADATPLAVVLMVSLANGVGEEVFFRGAIHAAVGHSRPGPATAVIYVAVTLATGNAALVVAAAVMGAVFGLERMASGGVAAPIVTHLTWSTLIVLALPR